MESSGSQGDRGRPDDPGRQDDPGRRRLTIAIALAAVFALAAVGLGIWALTTKSDLDDAHATIDDQKIELAQQRATAANTQARQEKFGRTLAKQYATTRDKLYRSRNTTAQLVRDVNKQKAQYTKAQRQVAAANTATGKLQAQLDAAQQQQDLSAACARGALDSIDLFFTAASAKSGAKAAVKQLNALDNQCAAAVRS